ncbi:Glutathione S-transferase [Candidatus Phaeomarinobacter ectocarpi]|uniref:Glutathione S-transferase n=1 Tax=Candidatus Phaeomarinibacter ectocarpi TaxID=1458461 RepID=X5MMW4_9HYPH|nr:glutathione S-transferase family protein [Candidatus Phaeomarinobacter ectocarpi]CDO59596.1 Glutathione S-transferase [Candidatus Phaeomarinobacter ectocarpi]
MIKLWGISVSYYTGKLEAYLRYKGIPYEMDNPFAHQDYIKKNAGAVQVPIIEREDGAFLSDSTPIIQHMETELPDRPVFPTDPVVRFIALLIEDYADEWLWRSAMNYRWSNENDRELLSSILADEVAGHLKAPRFVRRRMVKRRQLARYIKGDGVTPETRSHVDAGYFAALRSMASMLETRPFLLGNAPSIADFGLMGPMLRHYGQDPTPAAIMRNDWPAIAEWVARVWNASSLTVEPDLVNMVPDDAAPMLQEVAQTHLVQLRENARAFSAGHTKFKMTVQGCHYKNLPVTQYRVYCLERLREEFDNLSDEHKAKVKALLPYEGCELLWDHTVEAKSGHDVDRKAPFAHGINIV